MNKGTKEMAKREEKGKNIVLQKWANIGIAHTHTCDVIQMSGGPKHLGSFINIFNPNTQENMKDPRNISIFLPFKNKK